MPHCRRQRERLAQLRHSPLAIETDAANRQHYEVPAAFFQACLGHRLKYSSCYYHTGTETLDQAEDAMLELYGQRAGLANGQQVAMRQGQRLVARHAGAPAAGACPLALLPQQLALPLSEQKLAIQHIPQPAMAEIYSDWKACHEPG